MTKRAGLKAIVCLSGLVAVCYGTARSYLAYEASRASSMLHDLESVKVGDPEASVISISENYGGYRWIPEFREPDDQTSDCVYVLEANPWRFPSLTGHTRKFDDAVHKISSSLNSRLRRTVGLRMWNVIGSISLKENHVIALSGSAFVEGRDQWLGGMWHISGNIPKYELERFQESSASWPEMNRYLIGWVNLNMAGGLREAVESWITPDATYDEKLSARRFNLQCMTSRTGCQTVCDLVPDAVGYAREHPQLRLGGSWDAGTGTCIASRTDRYW